MPESKPILKDVVLIRPIIIFLLIVYHAFIIYQGGWSEPEEFAPVAAYWWIAKVSYSILLPMFVFVSGYVFAFQVIVLGKPIRVGDVAIRKFRRLLLPCYVFGAIYYFLFEFSPTDFFIFQFLYSVANGIGHLWFLPMLFWCFVGGAVVMKRKWYIHRAVIAGGILSLMSFVVPNYFQLSQSAFYFIFFLLGIIAIVYREAVLRVFTQLELLIVSSLGYFATFILGTWLIARLNTSSIGEGLMGKSITIVAVRACMYPYILFGMIALYGWINRRVKAGANLPCRLIKLNSMCFGIYILQQFILKILYYDTSLPVWVGNIWLPVVGCIITFLLSVAVIYCLRKIPFVRQLIG